MDTVRPERSTMRIPLSRSVSAPSRGQAHYPSGIRAPQTSDMNTAESSRAPARLRAAYSRTLKLPGPANFGRSGRLLSSSAASGFRVPCGL